MPWWAGCAFRIACVAAFGTLLIEASSARADEREPRPAVTILLIEIGGDPTSVRLAAELRASGLAVTTIQDAPLTRTDSEIRALARLAGAVATVDVDTSAGQARIWTLDPSTQELVLRTLVRLDDDPAVAALRVVEVLRAAINEPEVVRPPPVAPVGPVLPVVPVPVGTVRMAPAIPVEDGVRSPTVSGPRVGVSLGPAFAAGAVHLGGSWQGLASLYWLWSPRWGAELFGAAPLTSARRTNGAGSGTLSMWLAAAGIRARTIGARWCVLDVSAGVGTAALHTQGSPNQGFFGDDAVTWVTTPYVRMGYAVPITPNLGLRADLAAAFAIPRLTFGFADDAIAWGEPILVAALGVEATFR